MIPANLPIGSTVVVRGLGELFATMSSVGAIYSGVIPLPFPR